MLFKSNIKMILAFKGNRHFLLDQLSPNTKAHLKQHTEMQTSDNRDRYDFGKGVFFLTKTLCPESLMSYDACFGCMEKGTIFSH